jgi:23S rRNA (guanosine2251-2'-O)-methyltransferase
MSEIIEGRNPVLEALKSGRPINKILLAQNIGGHSAIAEIIQISKSRSIPVEYKPRDVLEKLAGPASQGVLAYASAKEYISLDDLIQISKRKNEPALYCILDGLEDPQNLGAIIRTTEASGFHGVVIRSRREVGLTAAVARASAGAIEYVPVARVINIAQTIEALKKLNVWVIGIDPSAETTYTEVDFRVASAIVIGGEGSGISDLVKKRCDLLASIPMQGKINSLNASASAAIVMYEALRQRSARWQVNHCIVDEDPIVL